MKRLALLSLIAVVITGCASTANEPPAQTSYDGMNLVSYDKHTNAYKKADFKLSDYDKVLILPSQVAFKKNWQRDQNNSRIANRVSNKDVERIKNDVAKVFDETFAESVAKSKAFTIVTEPGDGVLILKPAVINLDVYAPDLQSPGRTASFAEAAGRGTLALELYDSVSNEIMARYLNSRETRDHGYHAWSTRVSNRADMKDLIRRWSNDLAGLIEGNK